MAYWGALLRQFGSGNSPEQLRRLRLMNFMFPLLTIGLVFFWLIPRFNFRDVSSLGAADQKEVQRFLQDVNDSVARYNNPPTSDTGTQTATVFRPTCSDCTDFRQTAVSLTPFVSLLVKVPVYAYPNRTIKASVGRPEYYPRVRVDNFALSVFTLIGLTLGAWAVSAPSIKLSVKTATQELTGSKLTAEEFLQSDVERAEERARDIYKRSTILLAGGIVMAFVGVAVFYVTLPTSFGVPTNELDRERYLVEVQRNLQLQRQIFLLRRGIEARSSQSPNKKLDEGDQDDSDFAPARVIDPGPVQKQSEWLLFASRSLRPTGMLIFMEGIAWFLLRQYRVLIEEYKAFLRVYLKRSSFLVAWKAASSGVDKEFLIAQAMIGEDLSGAITKDQTTEVLEAIRVAEPTPIVEVLREVKELVPKLNK